ncbi:MAG: tetratricopeptide repeat protein [Candidatus Lindowbacteria bacterium]|nr:tetratricopeptide repeat protein [Candidatus Lindowbacteria bacterium]
MVQLITKITFPADIRRYTAFALSCFLVTILSGCGLDQTKARQLAGSNKPESMEKAAEIFQDEINEMTELYKDNIVVRTKLARQLMKNQIYGGALPHITYAVKMMPTDPDVRLDYAICLFNIATGNLAEMTVAETAYKDVLELDPQSSKARYGLAIIEFRVHDNKPKALRLLSDATALDPNYADAYVLSAVIQQQQGNLFESASLYKRALGLIPKMTLRRKEVLELYQAVLLQMDFHDQANQVQRELFDMATK